MKTLLTDERLIQLLTEASNAYYNTDTRIMSDEEFDELELEYQKRFGKKFIGAAPLAGKGTINVDHQYANLVGTLSKCKTIDEFMEWYENALSKINYVSKNGYGPELYVTLKYDGNSIVIEYKDGKVTKVLTRGKEGKGLDLTHVFADYHELEVIMEECGIKYEVIMTYENFEALMKAENMTYANPRSIVAGKLGCDEAAKYADYFTLVPLWLKYKDRDITRSEEQSTLAKEFGCEWSDFVGDYVHSVLEGDGDLDGVRRSMERFYNEIISVRDKLPFMIDGLVIEFVDEDIREQLGMNTGFPNWATALKFPYMEKSSKVTGFDFTLGDTGRITPRVWFEPVEFNGTVHTKQSLQNYARFKELNLSIGSDILVQYSHDCLTYIERLETENNKKLDKDPWNEKHIITCPECHTCAETNDTGAFLICPNPDCTGKTIGKLQNYLTKMDIKGIKENMLISMNEAGLVNGIIDLYTMDYSKIADIERMGKKVADNVKKAINGKVPYDYEILGSLGIPNCSRSTSKDICKVYSLSELLEMRNTICQTNFILKLTEIEGIADITAGYIQEGIDKNMETIQFLLNRNHLVYKDELNKNKTDKPEVIVFTGFRDKDLQAKLEMMGHKVTGSVSNNTTVVVTKDVNGSSSKLKKARELNIPIMNPVDFKAKYVK